MTPHEIKLVQNTFMQVAPIAPKAAELFYAKLFELDPNLKPLFKGDMTEQGAKLMKMIGMAVNSLNDLDALVPVVQSLGKRHVDYGVEDEHYDTVGEALLWTLGQGLGDAFDQEVEAAWTKTYVTLASVMKDAANVQAA
ncbi:MAG: globin family protein [Aliiglaciecola sp.]|uniref:globin family protein n=1 Tax=Aliiglaciecola sp. M165 TaxID=2593649 RepID=UPI00117FB224|nr:globin family protein [Aliiglaciecola sp. M165]TRY29289.1 hemin receptor [Aliiglaciecola sp. M165]